MHSVVYDNTIAIPLRRSRSAFASRRETPLLDQWLRILDDSYRPWLEVATQDKSTKGWSSACSCEPVRGTSGAIEPGYPHHPPALSEMMVTRVRAAMMVLQSDVT